MADFSFGQIEAVLAWQHQIADHKRTAFASRLKHLQKNGLPKRERPGRGKAGVFTFPQLVQIAIGIEFIQSGIAPGQAAKLVEGNWSVLRTTSYLSTRWPEEYEEVQAQAAERGETRDYAVNWLWLVRPEAMQELTREGVSEWDHMEAVLALPLADAVAHMQSLNEQPRGKGTRVLVINGSRLVRDLMSLAAYTFKYATIDDMRRKFEQEEDEYQARLAEATASFEPFKAKKELTPEAKQKVADAIKAWRDYVDSPLPPTQDALNLAQSLWTNLSVRAQAIVEGLARENYQFVIDGQEAKDAVVELVEADVAQLVPEDDEVGFSMTLSTLGEALLKVVKDGGLNVGS